MRTLVLRYRVRDCWYQPRLRLGVFAAPQSPYLMIEVDSTILKYRLLPPSQVLPLYRIQFSQISKLLTNAVLTQGVRYVRKSFRLTGCASRNPRNAKRTQIKFRQEQFHTRNFKGNLQTTYPPVIGLRITTSCTESHKNKQRKLKTSSLQQNT